MSVGSVCIEDSSPKALKSEDITTPLHNVDKLNDHREEDIHTPTTYCKSSIRNSFDDSDDQKEVNSACPDALQESRSGVRHAGKETSHDLKTIDEDNVEIEERQTVYTFPSIVRRGSSNLTSQDNFPVSDIDSDDYGVLGLADRAESAFGVSEIKKNLSTISEVLKQSGREVCEPLPPLSRMVSVHVRASGAEVVIHLLGIALCFISIVFCCVEFIGMIPDLRPSEASSGDNSCKRYEASIAALANNELEIETELEEE